MIQQQALLLVATQHCTLLEIAGLTEVEEFCFRHLNSSPWLSLTAKHGRQERLIKASALVSGSRPHVIQDLLTCVGVCCGDYQVYWVGLGDCPCLGTAPLLVAYP